MHSLDIISSINTESKSRKKYYDENALKAYKEDIKSYKKGSNNDMNYTYELINGFLQINNVNNYGINLINIKTTKVNKERAKNIIKIIKGIDRRMVPYNSKEILYKGITHISKITLDNRIPFIYKSYNSTTTDYKTAISFANAEKDEYRILLRLTINPAIKVYNYKDTDNEFEFLLQRNTIISNFVFTRYDEKNKVYVYDAIVSKYNPYPLFIPQKTSLGFLDLKLDKEKNKLIKIFDIKKTSKPSFY
jgi:hypothetical protein